MKVLGLDFSTQQLKAVVYSTEIELSIPYTLSDHPSHTGKQASPEQDEIVVVPTIVFVKALDTLFQRLQQKIDLTEITAISGCAQQHTSCYYRIPEYDHTKPLAALFDACFTFDSPTWQDHSTTAICEELKRFPLAQWTGSRPYERFTLSQIIKRYRSDPEKFKQTEHIGLLSSFIPSVLLGKQAQIDSSDACGMNLLDIETRQWRPELLELCDGLQQKLGPVGEANEILGQIHPYFTKRYGLDCKITTFTGDNPATLASMNSERGDLIISLGTSDTAIFVLDDPKPQEMGHIFCFEDHYMGLLCYRNGSLARERIRDMYYNQSWQQFNQDVESSSSDGSYGFYFFEQEIQPKAKGVYYFKDGKPVQDLKHHARRILESQFLMIKQHTLAFGFNPKRVIVCGGASENKTIQKLLAQIFGLPVYSLVQQSNAASLGACLRARKLFGLPDQTKLGTPVVASAVEHPQFPLSLIKSL
ncbi:xylulose kinase-like protein [Gorgonomyces haynaldii]|nr:xylulose kinase-like protein [Gorgonomyces haynaldii]